MRTLNKIIEALAAIETRIIRHNAAKRAARVACRIALSGCRV